MKGRQKRLTARKGFDDVTVVLQYDAHRTANLIVVIDDEDLGFRDRPAFGGTRRAGSTRRERLGE